MDALELAKLTLRGAGVLVYSPAEHPDICKAPYVVLRYSGTYASITSAKVGSSTIEVNCYVPLAQYDQLFLLKKQVKAIMKALEHQIKPTGHESADLPSDTYKAHTSYIEYQVLKRL